MNPLKAVLLLAVVFFSSHLQLIAQPERLEVGSETTDSTNTLCKGCYTETWLHDSLRIGLRQHEELQIFGSGAGDKVVDQIIIYNNERVPHTIINLDDSGNVIEIVFNRYRSRMINRKPTKEWIKYDEKGHPIELIYYDGSGNELKRLDIGG